MNGTRTHERHVGEVLKIKKKFLGTVAKTSWSLFDKYNALS